MSIPHVIKVELRNNWGKLLLPSSLPYKERQDFLDEVNEALSYTPAFSEWSPKFKSGKWNGKLYLFNKKNNIFPSGCLMRIKKVIEAFGYQPKLLDKRQKPDQNMFLHLIEEREDRPGEPFGLRDYQEEARDISTRYGSGILSCPTGSGKTTIFTSVIAKLSVAPVVIFVPTRLLLYQTKRELEEMLRDEDGQRVTVGIVGDGKVDIQPITVCIINSALAAYGLKFNNSKQKCEEDKRKKIPKEEQEELSAVAARREEIQALIETAKVIIADEAHRCASDMWRQILMRCKRAYYRFGFSATPFREDGRELEIEAVFGRILYEIELRELIDRGYLMDPEIYMVTINHDPEGAILTKEIETDDPDTGETIKVKKEAYIPAEDWEYRDFYEQVVIYNDELNNHIAQYAKTFNEQGMSVLILIKEITHGDILNELIPGSIFLKGNNTTNQRESAIGNLKEKECLTIIATSLADMGLDVRNLDCLILGGGGGSDPTKYQKKNHRKTIAKSEVARKWGKVASVNNDDAPSFLSIGAEATKTKDVESIRFGGVIQQRLGRVLRKAEGKEKAIVIDFWFVNSVMQSQSAARKKIFESLKLKVKRIR
jgi:superfamily II DNA or RNA helicase